MPWVMRKNESTGKTCIYKEGADGEPTGDSLGCHATEAEAKQQMAALYANVHKAVKFAEGSEDVVEGPGMPWGGPFANSDLDGQRFTAKTDFAFDWFGKGARPLLYHHGLDSEAGTDVVGRVKSWEVKTDLGVWTQAQLDKQSKYFAAIKEMITAGKLYFSSGAMAHLVEVGKSGEIKRWPWVELSLTPTPSNLLATVDLATVEKHYKSAGLELRLPEAAKAELSTERREDLSESDFAYIDSEGGRHLPMHDAVHARNALARFDQTKFESDEAKRKARKRLTARAKELGIEVSEDSAKSAGFKTASYEDIRSEIDSLLNKRMAMMVGPLSSQVVSSAYVHLTYPNYAICCLWQDGKSHYIRVPYTLGEDGHVASIGEAEEVEQTYVPTEHKALDGASLIDHAILTAHYAASLSQRTKDLHERRTKEGRVLSSMNRKRLTECMASMRMAMEDLQGLLDQTEPAKAVNLLRLRAQLEASRLHSLTIN